MSKQKAAFRVIGNGVPEDGSEYASKVSALSNARKWATEHDTWAAAQRRGRGETEWVIFAAFEAGGVPQGEVEPHAYDPNPPHPVPSDLPVLCRRCGLSDRAEIHQRRPR